MRIKNYSFSVQLNTLTLYVFFLAYIGCFFLGGCTQNTQEPIHSRQIAISEAASFLNRLDSVLNTNHGNSTVNADSIFLKALAMKDSLSYYQGLLSYNKQYTNNLNDQRQIDEIRTKMSEKEKELNARLEQEKNEHNKTKEKLEQAYNSPAVCVVGTYKELLKQKFITSNPSKERALLSGEPRPYFKVIPITNLNSPIDFLSGSSHSFADILSRHKERFTTYSIEKNTLLLKSSREFWTFDKLLIIEVQ